MGRRIHLYNRHLDNMCSSHCVGFDRHIFILPMFMRKTKGWYARHIAAKPTLPSDLIPLIDGIDMARTALNAELHDNLIVRSSHTGGKGIFEYMVFEMLGGTDDSVPVYAVKPPMKTPEVIHDIYLKYKIGSDGTAIHNMDHGDTLTNL